MQKLLPAAGEAKERDLSLDVEYSERENLAQMRFQFIISILKLSQFTGL